tara:strand:- start:195 stop:518 length:324 start_codon:yes stop_codon:yes gene_type:complete
LESEVILDDLKSTASTIFEIYDDLVRMHKKRGGTMYQLPEYPFEVTVEVSHKQIITIYASDAETASSLAIEQVNDSIPKDLSDPFCISTKLFDCNNLDIDVLEIESA